MSESSIVNEVISEISVFFKTHKITNFPPIRRFYAQKTIVFVVFCSLVFVLLVGFCLICVFMGSKSFVIKNINSLKTVLITSFTMLLTCAPIIPPMENLFIRTNVYLRSSVRISSFYKNLFKYLLIYDHLCESIFLSLYENKQAYEYRCLKQIFYHQNTVMIFC